MFGSTARKLARFAGLDVHRIDPNLWSWSHSVDDYYPVDPLPRWGFGKPAHPLIDQQLSASVPEFRAMLDRIAVHAALFASVPQDGDADSFTPFWKSEWLQNLDSVMLMAMLADHRPRTYLEIGSGVSTKFARHTIRHLELATQLRSIDPFPRFGIDGICDSVVRKRLEECDLAEFDSLASGDILFFDGSHRTFQNSDVTVFFLDILPRLKPGVIIHIHDIFLPWDYPPRWMKRMYSEQYMLAALLMWQQKSFKVTAPNFFMCQQPALATALDRLLRPLALQREGFSFWLEKLA